MSITVLTGHTSPETAYLQDDYPYGYTLRCQRRAWIEYKPKQGYRFVTQTSNPKRAGLVWNNPKASTYHALMVMYLDDQGHVQVDSLSPYSTLAAVEQFAAVYAEALQDPREQRMLDALRKVASVADEHDRCLAFLRTLPPTSGAGVTLQRGPYWLQTGYGLWTSSETHAFVLADVATAEALLAAYPRTLKDAVIITRVAA